MNQQIKQLCND